jgi:hypothetical protein
VFWGQPYLVIIRPGASKGTELAPSLAGTSTLQEQHFRAVSDWDGTK